MAKKAAKKAAAKAAPAATPAEKKEPADLLGGTSPKASAKKSRPISDLGVVTGVEASLVSAGFKTIDALVAWYAEGNEFDKLAHISEGAARSIEAQLTKLVHNWKPRKDRAPSWANAEIALVLADLEPKTVKIFQAREIVTLGDLVPTWQDKEGRAELVAIIDPKDLDYLDKYVDAIDKQTAATPSFPESAVSSAAIALPSTAQTNGSSSANVANAAPARSKTESGSSTSRARESVKINADELGRLQGRDELLARIEKERIEIEALRADWAKKKDSALAAKKRFDEASATLLDMIGEANDPQLRLPFPTAPDPDLEPEAAAAGDDEGEPIDAEFTIVPDPVDENAVDRSSGWRGESVNVMLLGPSLTAKLVASGTDTLGKLADLVAADGLGKVKGLGKKSAADVKQRYEEYVDRNVRANYSETNGTPAAAAGGKSKPTWLALLRQPKGTSPEDNCEVGAKFPIKSWLGRNPIITTDSRRDISLTPADWEAAEPVS